MSRKECKSIVNDTKLLSAPRLNPFFYAALFNCFQVFCLPFKPFCNFNLLLYKCVHREKKDVKDILDKCISKKGLKPH